MTKISVLNERPTEERAVTQQTEIFLKSAQAALKEKGFVRENARIASAIFEWTFVKGERRIVVYGWHGTGKRGTSRWFGDLKALLIIYDNKAYVGSEKARWKSDKVLDIDVIEGTVVDHTKMLTEATNYLAKV